jgi:phosphomannomutase
MYYSCSQELADLTKSSPGGISTGAPWAFDGAISVTASHLPQQWNGFKFFTPDHPSNIGEEGIQGIIDSLAPNELNDIVPRMAEFSNRPCPSFLPVYSDFLKSTVVNMVKRKYSETSSPSLTNKDDIGAVAYSDDDFLRRPLAGLKICVNAGNGAGGFLAQTLSELGADTSSSLHLEPDGTVSK